MDGRFILFLVTLLGFLKLGTFFDWLRQQAGLLLPGQAMLVVDRVIGELQQRQGGILSLSVVIALWSASGGVRGLMNALNRARWRRIGQRGSACCSRWSTPWASPRCSSWPPG
ncbi:MAG: YihY/virulence factor BrkB family protein [Chloroflexales bacterium]|nr:YihY/virulence factor BrkB family protein [Chloroflexales bacterium]